MRRLLNQLKQLVSSLSVRPKTLTMNESKSTIQIQPPDVVRGMKELDRAKFSKTLIVPSIIVSQNDVPKVISVVKNDLMKMVKFKTLVDDRENGKKALLLNPVKIKSFSDLPDKSRSVLEKLGYNFLQSKTIDITYDNFNSEDIFRAVLPEDKDSCTSYSIIGHIVQVNLRDHLLEYEKLIGEVLLDKVSVAKTVVCKTDTIDNTFRTFSMNVICGEDNMITSVKENGCTFELDFSKVYWNARLGTEHSRIVNNMKKPCVLYDVFAGIGPFSVLAAKKKCTVLANDLNPHSFKWLERNVKLNKVTDKVTIFNKDGGEFIETDVKKHLQDLWERDEDVEVHVTMNLPALAVTFLRHFRALLPPHLQGLRPTPVVHVYCFTKNATDPAASAVSVVEENLETQLGTCLKSVHNVRTVSNFKEMMAVSFFIPPEVLFAPKSDAASDEPPAKKLFLSNDSCE